MNEKDLEKLYKQLEILDSIKLKKKSLNDFFLKRIEQKEIQRAEANAVLAAHYLKLKKYYGDGTFDKYLKQLTEFTKYFFSNPTTAELPYRMQPLFFPL